MKFRRWTDLKTHLLDIDLQCRKAFQSFSFCSHSSSSLLSLILLVFLLCVSPHSSSSSTFLFFSSCCCAPSARMSLNPAFASRRPLALAPLVDLVHVASRSQTLRFGSCRQAPLSRRAMNHSQVALASELSRVFCHAASCSGATCLTIDSRTSTLAATASFFGCRCFIEIGRSRQVQPMTTSGPKLVSKPVFSDGGVSGPLFFTPIMNLFHKNKKNP